MNLKSLGLLATTLGACAPDPTDPDTSTGRDTSMHYDTQTTEAWGDDNAQRCVAEALQQENAAIRLVFSDPDQAGAASCEPSGNGQIGLTLGLTENPEGLLYDNTALYVSNEAGDMREAEIISEERILENGVSLYTWLAKFPSAGDTHTLYVVDQPDGRCLATGVFVGCPTVPNNGVWEDCGEPQSTLECR